MVVVIKYALIKLVHINAAVIEDTFQVEKNAKVYLTIPLATDIVQKEWCVIVFYWILTSFLFEQVLSSVKDAADGVQH